MLFACAQEKPGDRARSQSWRTVLQEGQWSKAREMAGAGAMAKGGHRSISLDTGGQRRDVNQI
jgi:hypothetical protein